MKIETIAGTKANHPDRHRVEIKLNRAKFYPANNGDELPDENLIRGAVTVAAARLGTDIQQAWSGPLTPVEGGYRFELVDHAPRKSVVRGQPQRRIEITVPLAEAEAEAARPPRPLLILPRGYPGSGKSTVYREMRMRFPWLAKVSRDDLRTTVFSDSGVLSGEQESLITTMERAQVRALLASGTDTFLDNMNLNPKYAGDWASFALRHGADWLLIDLPTPIDECVARDAARGLAGGNMLGEDVVRSVAKRWPEPWPAIKPSGTAALEIEPYQEQDGLPWVVLVDVDGTLADNSHRNPYDYSQVAGDRPNQHVVAAVTHFFDNGPDVIVLSGRDDSCKRETAKWLEAADVPFDNLLMRRTGDKRSDAIVKLDLFNKHIRGRYNVAAVFDDRLQVCRMWSKLGVPLFRLGVPDADDF